MRTACGFLLILAVPLSAAPVPKELRAGDEIRILGVWYLEKARYGEMEYGGVGTKWTLGADGMAIRERLKEEPGPVVYKIDPKAAVKTLDWDNGTFPGVYELAGDSLRVALGGGTTRPAACKPGDSVYYFEFRRIK